MAKININDVPYEYRRNYKVEVLELCAKFALCAVVIFGMMSMCVFWG